jgi:hypothetical protein
MSTEQIEPYYFAAPKETKWHIRSIHVDYEGRAHKLYFMAVDFNKLKQGILITNWTWLWFFGAN